MMYNKFYTDKEHKYYTKYFHYKSSAHFRDKNLLVSGHIPITIGIESMNVDMWHDNTL